jgi:P-type E1-E2 ATPase
MIILFFCYFFLLNTMLPISIIFSFEVVKLYQAALVAWDTDIYETKYGHSARVNNCQLMEELGQIHYLFTDKTGTLTRNEMKMKAIIVGQNVYGDISQPGFKIQEQFMSSDCSYSEHHSKNVYDWP